MFSNRLHVAWIYICRKFRGWCLSLSSVVYTLLMFKLGDKDQVLADLVYNVSGKAPGTNVHD